MIAVIFIVIMNIAIVQRTLCNIYSHFRVTERMLFFAKSTSGTYSQPRSKVQFIVLLTDRRVGKYKLMGKIIHIHFGSKQNKWTFNINY